jgi:hypothetical protein
LFQGKIARCQPTLVVARANSRSLSCCNYAPLIHQPPETDQDRQVNTLRNLDACAAISLPVEVYGLSQCSIECLLATLNCSSAGGGPIVAQNKMPKSVAEKIMVAISLKYIGPTPH